MSTQFGELLKRLRIAKEITLRQCSAELGIDPSNWSKIERGINPAPKDANVLEAWVAFFGITGSDKQEFLDKAALSRSEIPNDLGSNERLMEALPVFFRAARGAEINDAQIHQFVDQLRKLNTPD